MGDVISNLTNPEKLVRRCEAVGRGSVIPSSPGIYAWCFRVSPSSGIRIDECLQLGDWTLLYVGISPQKPSRNGRSSRNRLRQRISGHLTGNASGSTLRLSLGCLLADTLGLQLRRIGDDERLHFAGRESDLSGWLEENAAVTWQVHPTPWEVEEVAIERLYLPLNLDMNEDHPFYPTLYLARQAAREKARQLGVVAKGWRGELDGPS